MSLPVPVIQASLNMPPVIALPAPDLQPVNEKRFIILHTVDIKHDDLALFNSYGIAIQYNAKSESLYNVDSLIFNYLFLDLRKQEDRKYYDLNNFNNYNVIVYCAFYEVFDNYIESLDCANIITKFGERVHYKNMFDASLLQKPLVAPSTCLSIINYVSNFLVNLKKQ